MKNDVSNNIDIIQKMLKQFRTLTNTEMLNQLIGCQHHYQNQNIEIMDFDTLIPFIKKEISNNDGSITDKISIDGSITDKISIEKSSCIIDLITKKVIFHISHDDLIYAIMKDNVTSSIDLEDTFKLHSDMIWISYPNASMSDTCYIVYPEIYQNNKEIILFLTNLYKKNKIYNIDTYISKLK